MNETANCTFNRFSEIGIRVGSPLLNPYFEIFETLRGQSPELVLRLRKPLIWAYSWAVPSSEAIAEIAQYTPLIELGAGSGYWAWLLRQAGADVIALDTLTAAPPYWTPVLKGDASSLGDNPGRALFLCWPPSDSPMAAQALQSFPGSTVISVGEWEGRTADAEFQRLLRQDWELIRQMGLPKWPGFRDELRIFRRREIIS